MQGRGNDVVVDLPESFGGFEITRQWLPKGKPPRSGEPVARPDVLMTEILGIVVGDTGVLGLTARRAAADLGQAYGHLLIDDRDIIECVPALTSDVGLVEQAVFVTPTRDRGLTNAQGTRVTTAEGAIAVNLCFGGAINAGQARRQYVAVLAYLCSRFGLAAERALSRAADLDPARRDPDSALATIGIDFKGLIAQVAAMCREAAGGGPAAQPARLIVTAENG
jgi:N-acetylmuramoyl-L-alanine amidase